MLRDVVVVGGVHAFGEGTEVVVEEAGVVDVEGHRGGGVAGHPLDRFDIRATRHEEVRRGVAEVVGTEILQSRCSSGRIEGSASEVAGPENAALE